MAGEWVTGEWVTGERVTGERVTGERVSTGIVVNDPLSREEMENETRRVTITIIKYIMQYC